MEHPYLAPLPPRKFESNIGESGRAAKQHAHIVRAVRTIDELIYSELPELVAKPVAALDENEFEIRITRIDAALQSKNLPRRTMVIAWNRLCTFIDKGNDAGDWTLPAVIPQAQLPTQSLLRTRRWQRHSMLVHEVHRKVIGAIETGDPALLDDRSVALALALFFGAVHSGICEASLLDALARAIIDKTPLDPGPDAPRVWVTLKVDEPPLTNMVQLVDGEEQRILIARRELDPLTVSMIRRCWDGTGDYPGRDFDRNTLVKWINTGLQRLDPSIPSLPSLKRFGRAALSIVEQHTALPHVYMEVACGRVRTCDLPDPGWHRLCGYAFNDPLEPKPDLIGEPDSCHRPVVESQRVSKATRDAIYTSLYAIVSRASSNEQATKKLRALESERYPLAAQLLVAWCLEHIERRGNVLSSMRSYLSVVGPGLIEAMGGADVYDADDLDDVYRSIIDGKKSDDAKDYAAKRLEDLHDVARGEFGFPALHEPLSADYKSGRHVRAAFIPEHVYVAALKEIANLPNRDRHYKNALKVALILAYRTGMRRNEILHLQLGDVEDSDDRVIFVRANSLGRLKSSSARRNIPAGALLPPAERKIFEAFYRHRSTGRSNKTDLLFCIEGSPKQPLDSHQVSNDVKRILWNVGFRGVLHDFRHTALSRMQLIAEREWALVKRFTVYSEKQAKRVYRAVFGHPRSAHARYWALAAFAGHSSPSTTFASYLHFSAVLLYEALNRSTLTYSRGFLSPVTGIGKTKLAKIAKSAGCDRDFLPLNILHDAVASRHSKVFRRLKRVDIDSAQRVDDELELPKTSIFTVHPALQAYERGYSIPSVAYEFGLTQDFLKLCIKRALILAAEMTHKAMPRLIGTSRAERRRPVITPAMPSDRILVADANAIIKGLRDAFLANKDEIEWAVCYWLTHTSTTEPYARFHRRRDLKRFIAVFRGIIPDNRWHIEVVTPAGRKDEEAIRAWRLRKGLAVVPKSVNRPPAYSVARLHLRHPHDLTLIDQLTAAMNSSKTEARRWVAEKYSAHTLRFVLHMLAIMIFDEHDLIAGLDACRDSGSGWEVRRSA